VRDSSGLSPKVARNRQIFVKLPWWIAVNSCWKWSLLGMNEARNLLVSKASARHHIYPLEKANVQDRNDSPGWGEGKRAYGESNTPKTSLTDSVRGQFICSLQMGQHRRRYIFFNITHGGSTARTARIVRQSRSRRYFLSLLDCRIPVSRGSTCYGRTCMNIKCRVTRGAFYHAPGDPSISFDSNRLSNT
jgi:hypothetical protein